MFSRSLYVGMTTTFSAMSAQEEPGMDDADAIEPVLEHRQQRLGAVDHAHREVHRRRFRHVPSRDRNLGNRETEGYGLGEDLRIEDEIVGVAQKGYLLEE